MVEKSIHIKFDDKESDNKMFELVTKILVICVFEDTSRSRGQEAESS